MQSNNIEWSDESWNIVNGCVRKSPGCQNCYAESIAARFNGPGQPFEGLARFVTLPDGSKEARWTHKINLLPERLVAPLKKRVGKKIFVNSASDLFLDEVPFSLIAAAFWVMAATPQHTYQILTKRPETARLFFHWLEVVSSDVAARHWDMSNSAAKYATCRDAALEYIDERIIEQYENIARFNFSIPMPNVWMGVSVENGDYWQRIEILRDLPAAVRFVSFEPLIGDIGVETNLKGIHLAIIGGESGTKAREANYSWFLRVMDRCYDSNCAVFVKQLGYRYHDRVNRVCGRGVDKSDDYRYWRRLKSVKGGDFGEFPEELRCREDPAREALV